MSHKGASRFKVLQHSLAKPDLATAEVVVAPGERSSMDRRGEGRAVRAQDERRQQRAVPPRVRARCASRSRLRCRSSATSMAWRPIRACRASCSTSAAGSASAAIYAYDPASARSSTPACNRRANTTIPATLVATEVKVKAADGTLDSDVDRAQERLEARRHQPDDRLWLRRVRHFVRRRSSARPGCRGSIAAACSRCAHVRGGGEYGEDWYKAGYKATKPNTWRDAIACAEWLVANKYTSSPKMSIMGGSAGGIFVGRAITDRPDLFGAAVDQVPVSDADARGILRQRRAQHPGVRHGQDRGRIQGRCSR